MDEAREELGPDQFDRFFQEGTANDPDQATDLVEAVLGLLSLLGFEVRHSRFEVGQPRGRQFAVALTEHRFERFDGRLQRLDVGRERGQSVVRPLGVGFRIGLPLHLDHALADGGREDLGRRFLNREIDLIITSDAMEDMDGLGRRPLCREGYVLLLPAGYDGPADSLPQLAERMPLIRFSSRNAMGQDVERHLRRVGIDIPRRAAFEACHYIMDYLKTAAPFWKKTRDAHGERWVEAREADQEAFRKWQ
jgi:hypothetical protein